MCGYFLDEICSSSQQEFPLSCNRICENCYPCLRCSYLQLCSSPVSSEIFQLKGVRSNRLLTIVNSGININVIKRNL